MIMVVNGNMVTSNAIIYALEADKCKEVHLIENPEEFYRLYESALFSDNRFKFNLPNEILAGKLYLGNEH
jgi:hypothetical protein